MTFRQAFENLVRSFWQVVNGTAPPELNACLNALCVVSILLLIAFVEQRWENARRDPRYRNWKD